MNSASYHQITHLPNRTIELDGKTYLYFSGTAYLGLPHNPAFQALIQAGLHEYGSVYGSSRNGNLQLSIYEQAEAKLAAWTGSEAALTLSSGMLAGQAAIRQLMLDGYEFVYSPDVHPAVWHLPKVSIPAVSFEEWVEKVVNPSFLQEASQVCLVTNSVDALRGKLYAFDWVTRLPKNQEWVLLIDDSHGLGVVGEQGKGIWEQVPSLPHVRVIVTASLAKAMGLPGGVIFSDKITLQKIRSTAYFGGCSPIAPNHLYAYLHATDLYADAYERLGKNVRKCSEQLASLGLFNDSNALYPVFYTPHDELYPFLLQRGIFVYSFAYPKPTDKANTRVVLSAWHTEKDIEILAEACRTFVETRH